MYWGRGCGRYLPSAAKAPGRVRTIAIWSCSAPLGPLFDIMIDLINYTSVTVKRHRRWGAHGGGLGGVVSVCIFVFKYSLLSGLLQLKLGSRQSNAAHHKSTSTSTKTKFLIFQKGTIRRDWVMKWNFVICAGNKYVFNLVGWWRKIVLLL